MFIIDMRHTFAHPISITCWQYKSCLSVADLWIFGLLTHSIVVQYGKQTVPISTEEENHLKYLPEKDMQVIGFVNLDQVPRHTYKKVLHGLA